MRQRYVLCWGEHRQCITDTVEGVLRAARHTATMFGAPVIVRVDAHGYQLVDVVQPRREPTDTHDYRGVD